MSKAKYRTEKEDYVIYAFTSPVDQKCFVWRCRKESIRDTYRFHKNFQRYFSERFMNAIEPHRPCMHVLEEVPQVTEVRTYRYVLAWIRIFMEHGYTCYNYQELLDQANDMQWTTKKLYDARKDECLDELLSCERCQVRVYKRAQCPFLENEIDE